MRKKTWRAIAGFVMGFSFLSVAHAQNAEDLTDTNAFRSAYALSYCFDACSDPEVGEVYRKALLDKLKYCPFSQEARNEFVEWATEQRETVAEQLREYMEQEGRFPDKFCNTKATCQEQRQSKVYQNFAGQIRRYNDGEIGVETLLPSPCNVEPGGL